MEMPAAASYPSTERTHLVLASCPLEVLPQLHLQVAAVACVGVVHVGVVCQRGIVLWVDGPDVLEVISDVAVGLRVADRAVANVAAVLPAFVKQTCQHCQLQTRHCSH